MVCIEPSLRLYSKPFGVEWTEFSIYFNGESTRDNNVLIRSGEAPGIG